MATERVRLGHMVVCTGFRNPALTAKLASTIDVISGGRFELGIGAGWKEDEWLAYGYGFPPIGERLGAFGDHLEVITRMLAPGRATYEGKYAHVRDAINVPKGLQQPRIPIIVGGNGEQRDRAATPSVRRRAELRLPAARRDRRADGRRPRSAARRSAATPRRCASRSTPGTRTMRDAGQERVDLHRPVRGDRARPARRFPTRWSPTPEAQAAFAEDCRRQASDARATRRSGSAARGDAWPASASGRSSGRGA